MAVKPIREGFHAITPYFFARDAAKLAEFLVAAFNGKINSQGKRPDGSIAHIEMRIGDSMLMLGEPSGGIKPTSISIYLYVTDCDAIYAQAMRAGGIPFSPIMNLPSGERYGGIKDPAGNLWWIATHVEDVSPDEEQRRWKEFYENMKRK